MDSHKIDLKKGYLIFLVVYLISSLLFLYIARDQIKYTQEEITKVTDVAEANAGMLNNADVITQEITSEHQYLTGISVYFATFGKNNHGTGTVSVVKTASGEVITSAEVPLNKVADNSWYQITFPQKVRMELLKNEKIEIQISFKGMDAEDAITVGLGSTSQTDGGAKVNGAKIAGMVCMTLYQTNLSAYQYVYPLFLALLFVLLILVGIHLVRQDRKGKITPILKYVYLMKKYRFLMKQLVARDFKTKYKRSVLGVFWSFLNPLLTMSVQYAVFSRIFRFNIPNYAVYLLTGIVLFNGFSDVTTQAMNAIVGNAALITKVYVPKYIYPISKVFSSGINILFSLIPLMLVAILTGVKLTPALLMIPYILFFFLLFLIGMSFILSSAMTFFRDMQFLWGVFTMMWMYATPVIYSIDILEGTFLYGFQKINPLYYYISFFRTLIIDGTSPEPVMYLICVMWAVLALGVGGFIFKKSQDKFVLYI